MFPYYTLVNKKTAKCSNSLLGLTVCLHFSGLRWNLIRQQSLHFVLDNFVFKTFFFFLKVLGWTNPIFCVGVELERSQRGRQKGKQCLDVLYSYFSRFRPPVMFPCVFFSVFVLFVAVRTGSGALPRARDFQPGEVRYAALGKAICSRENVLTLFSFTEKRSARKHFKKDKTINIKKKSALPQHTGSLGRTPEENKKNKENTRAQTKTNLTKA